MMRLGQFDVGVQGSVVRATRADTGAFYSSFRQTECKRKSRTETTAIDSRGGRLLGGECELCGKTI